MFFSFLLKFKLVVIFLLYKTSCIGRLYTGNIALYSNTFSDKKNFSQATTMEYLINQIFDMKLLLFPLSLFNRYELYNRDSFTLQNELFYLSSEIPNYLSNRPGKLTQHIYERLKTAASRNFYITDIHPGIFSVQGCEGPDDHIHTISFGDNTSYPSCDCEDWQRFKLPCVHFAAVYNTYPGWTWDMMGNPYRTNPIFNADWSVISPDLRIHAPGSLNDVATQTTGANLITTCVPEFSLTKINEQRRAAETPQVMASQCRGLLQQLGKLQLAHHSKDSLYRLRSELKELISIFSAAPKTKILFPLTTTAPLKGRKQGGLGSSQSVFEQYNVKLITPKQVTLNKMDVASGGTRVVHDQSSDIDTDDDEVDGMYISTVGEEQIVEENEEQQQVIMTIPSIQDSSSSTTTTSNLKRIQDASHQYLKDDTQQNTDEPAQKKLRYSTTEAIQATEAISTTTTTAGTDGSGGNNEGEILNAPQITLEQHTVEGDQGGKEVVVEATDSANVMQFPSNTTLSTVIDGQTISISLDQVAQMALNGKVSVSTTGVDTGQQELLTFTAPSSSVGEEGGTLIISGDTSENVEKDDDDTTVK